MMCSTSLCRELYKNGWTDRFPAWLVDSGTPKEAQFWSYSPGGANHTRTGNHPVTTRSDGFIKVFDCIEQVARALPDRPIDVCASSASEIRVLRTALSTVLMFFYSSLHFVVNISFASASCSKNFIVVIMLAIGVVQHRCSNPRCYEICFESSKTRKFKSLKY